MRSFAIAYRARLRALAAETGFTLVELLVVIIIVVVLADVAAQSFLSQQDKARASVAQQQLLQVSKASQALYIGNNEVFYGMPNLVNQLQAGEPGMDFAQGTSFVYNRISVQRQSPQDITLRTLTQDGEGYALRRIESGLGQGIYKTHGTSTALVTNLITNPSLEIDNSDWTGSNNGVSSSPAGVTQSSWAASGKYSGYRSGVDSTAGAASFVGAAFGQAAGLDVPVSAGQQVSATVTFNVTDPAVAGDGAYVLLQFRDASNNVLSNSGRFGDVLQSGVFTVTGTDTAPIGAAEVVLYVRLSSSADNDSLSFSFDKAMVNVGSEQPYLDGDQPGAAWNGPPHASTSTGPAWEDW